MKFLFLLIITLCLIGLFRIIRIFAHVRNTFRGEYIPKEQPKKEGEVTLREVPPTLKKTPRHAEDVEFEEMEEWEKVQGIEDIE